MRRGHAIFGLSSFVLLTALVAGACSSDKSTGSGTTAADVQGQWTLVSINEGGTTLAPPTATGALQLTLTKYYLTLNLPDPVGTQYDSGTYTISGANWSQTSQVNGSQSVGTDVLSGNKDTLNVNTTTQGTAVATVWTRTP